jgi:hypothetical protein
MIELEERINLRYDGGYRRGKEEILGKSGVHEKRIRFRFAPKFIRIYPILRA